MIIHFLNEWLINLTKCKPNQMLLNLQLYAIYRNCIFRKFMHNREFSNSKFGGPIYQHHSKVWCTHVRFLLMSIVIMFNTWGTISKLTLAIHIHTKAVQRERTLWWFFFFFCEWKVVVLWAHKSQAPSVIMKNKLWI